MQKLIRETEGFVSVPRESDMIWLPHCHPNLNDWEYEGCPDSRITGNLVSRIQDAFSTQALSARTWRMFDRLGLMNRPRLATCLRLGYRALHKPWFHFRERRAADTELPGRLVDKSVHAGLWLNLVNRVFPDAVYIHMIRNPVDCVASMMHGWTSLDRFVTYYIPKSAMPNGSDVYRWCFPLPPGWRDYWQTDLLEVSAFQWNSINRSICESLGHDEFKNRVMAVELGGLSSEPDRSLAALADFLELDNLSGPQSGHTEGLPRVNPSLNAQPVNDLQCRRIDETTRETWSLLLERYSLGGPDS